MTKRRFALEPRKFWTADEDAILRRRYPDEPTAVVAAALGRSLAATLGRANTIGVEKSEAFRNSALSGRLLKGGDRGKASRFQPGQPAFNKGKSRPASWAPIPPETQFKKGQRTGVAEKLWKPIGSERVSKDGYLERKIHNEVPSNVSRRESARLTARRWRAVHLILWEEANGPLPKGYAVAFKNGNKRDIRLDNLELMKRADLMERNTIHNLPPELKETMQLLGRVNRQIRKRERNGQEQNQ